MNVELLTKVLDISRTLAETHDLDHLLKFAMEQTLQIVGGSFGYIILIDDDGGLNIAVRVKPEGFVDDGHGDELSRSIFNDVISSGQPSIITDAQSSNRYYNKSSVVDLKIRSVMCVPLIERGNKLGAIYVENRTVAGAFRDEDLDPLILFANQVAVSIENTMIISQLEQLVAERTEEVERSWLEAVEANRMRTMSLGQIAHDMRAPATVIDLAVQMLSSPSVGQLNDSQSVWLERSAQAVNQMVNFIENIFDLSKSELGSLRILPQETDLNEFLTRTYELCEGLPRSEEVNLRLEVEEDLPTIIIDPDRTKQVIMNLATNALKFTQEGEVVLHAKTTNGEVNIGVRDTGEGIPEELHEKVFIRFQQFDSNAARRTKGAGFGLAICKELVEKHGGRIWVNSAPGQGSDFVFSLPL